MPTIATVREFHEAGYRIHGWCLKCRRGVDASLERLIVNGRGDKLLEEIRLRHGCGSRVTFVLSAPQRHEPFDASRFR